MNDKEYIQQIRRIERYVKRWQPILGLGDWHIVVDYVRDPREFGTEFDGNASYYTLMDCSSRWEYKHGDIRINTIACMSLDDAAVETAVIHELMHFRVAEMRDWPDQPKHEERVVSDMVGAVLRTYQQGVKDGKKS